eukprot:538787-Amphidinium_carterae.1
MFPKTRRIITHDTSYVQILTNPHTSPLDAQLLKCKALIAALIVLILRGKSANVDFIKCALNALSPDAHPNVICGQPLEHNMLSIW